jgi:RNA polymerase sigma-70 factor (ECF subfamily)
MKEKRIYKKFETIYNQFSQGIFRYVYFKISDYELSQEVTSDTFLKYWKILSEDKKIENHKALLYFIAKCLIIDYYRKKKNKKQIALEKIDERLLESIDDAEETLLFKEELDEVYRKIRSLKKNYQDVLFLHYVEDLSIKEIAYIQKKKENAVRVLLHRALKFLKENL